MMRTLCLVICLVALMCGTALAQNPSTRDKDETAIRAVVVELSEAWTTAILSVGAGNLLRTLTIWR